MSDVDLKCQVDSDYEFRNGTFWFHTFFRPHFYLSDRSPLYLDENSTDFDYGDYNYDGNSEDASDVALTQNQKILLSRLSHSVFWALLVPDLYCFLYSLYFVLFKQVDWPKASQFFAILTMETCKFYA